ADARHPLPDGGQPGRRQRRDAARTGPAARAQDGPGLAGEDRRRRRAVVGADGHTRAQRRGPDQPATRVLGALPAATRPGDPHLVVLVLHNNDLNQVTWEQRAMEGDPRYEASQQLPDFPYARYAELIGLRGIRVDDPEQLADTWQEAFAADRPVVLEAITDPN